MKPARTAGLIDINRCRFGVKPSCLVTASRIGRDSAGAWSRVGTAMRDMPLPPSTFGLEKRRAEQSSPNALFGVPVRRTRKRRVFPCVRGRPTGCPFGEPERAGHTRRSSIAAPSWSSQTTLEPFSLRRPCAAPSRLRRQRPNDWPPQEDSACLVGGHPDPRAQNAAIDRCRPLVPRFGKIVQAFATHLRGWTTNPTCPACLRTISTAMRVARHPLSLVAVIGEHALAAVSDLRAGRPRDATAFPRSMKMMKMQAIFVSISTSLGASLRSRASNVSYCRR